MKTNDKGEFVIELKLEKDEKIEVIQIDNYEIQASVTDINGETQTATTNLTVSSVSHYIKANEIGTVFSDEIVKLDVETKNYNEQVIKKSYQVKLSKLKSPDRIFRNNYRTAIQDDPTYTKEEFIKLFPNDYYDKSEKLKNWKTEKIIINKTQEPSARLDLGKLESGEYLLELYNVEGKDTIKSVQNCSVVEQIFKKYT